MAAFAAPAAASVTLGQVGPTSGTCTANLDMAQSSVTSGASYTVPENGTITAWSHNAPASASQQFTMKVFRAVPNQANFFKVVGHDGPRPQTANLLNVFTTSIPVQAGDLLGLDTATGQSGCTINPSPSPGDAFLVRITPPPSLSDGQAALFGLNMNQRLDISAVLQPTNTITVGSTVLNKKKGTATISLTVPNSGNLTASGSGAQVTPTGAVSAGAVQLLVKATGKKRKTLNANGKVTLSVTITFTPTNGDPAAQTVKVKLKKKTKK